MPETLLLAVDQGTTGTTALLVTLDGTVRRRAHREVPVTYPRSGWVEQDALDLEASVIEACRDLLDGDDALRPAALGITNQRETVVVFERDTLRPVAPAIVWQCRRSAEICEEHRRAGEEDELRRRTGLLLDPYFSATKVEWLLRERPELRARAERGELCAATVDAWLIARLTGDGHDVRTDASNASRTLLYDLHRGDFSDELCGVFGVPRAMLPSVHDSAGRLGVTDPGRFLGRAIPISGVAGDQQAALFGQACCSPGMSKNTYGTGSFVLVNVGDEAPAFLGADAPGGRSTPTPSPAAGVRPDDSVPPRHGLLTTVAWRIGGRDTFALEGSIFVTGAGIKWLRDGLGLIQASAEAGPLFDSVPDAAGCFFVPAFAGLGAPYWDPGARGALVGLSAGVTRAHVVRAVVEAMAYRTRDVVEAMERSAGIEFDELRVDGGASVMDGMCQFQADLLGLPVARAGSAETTAVGAAWLAAVGEGLLDGPDAVAAAYRPGRRFEPRHAGVRPQAEYAAWLDAVRRVRS
ncbi:MAG TPA: glycerol kinase [Candidatus Dormibacteraeota bacterium]|jgi:glycerol kinase|nr:glycerol kinase [Candidatus Dormibacteraeota bacterium]